MNVLCRMNILFERLLRGLLASLVLVMVLCVSYQVLARLLLRALDAIGVQATFSPATWTEELASFLLVWCGVLGAAYALRVGEHLGMEMLTEKFPLPVQMHLEKFVRVAIIIFAIAMLFGGSLLVQMTFELKQRSAVLGLPMAWVYIAVPVAGFLFICFACERALMLNSTAANGDIV
jgi:TRAP-type C4-dicarboxylate transport system permease small subunit